MNGHLSMTMASIQVGRHWLKFNLERDGLRLVYLPRTQYVWIALRLSTQICRGNWSGAKIMEHAAAADDSTSCPIDLTQPPAYINKHFFLYEWTSIFYSPLSHTIFISFSLFKFICWPTYVLVDLCPWVLFLTGLFPSSKCACNFCAFRYLQ